MSQVQMVTSIDLMCNDLKDLNKNEQRNRDVNDNNRNLSKQHIWMPTIRQLRGIFKWYKLPQPGKGSSCEELVEMLQKNNVKFISCNNTNIPHLQGAIAHYIEPLDPDSSESSESFECSESSDDYNRFDTVSDHDDQCK